MNIRLLILNSILFSFFNHALCQVLTAECNNLRDGDSLCLTQAEYILCGEAGENAVWDFRDVKTVKSESFKFEQKNDSIIFAYGETASTCYKTSEKGISVCSVENQLQKVQYHKPLLTLPLTLSFGNIYSADIKSTINYCNKSRTTAEGSVLIDADGFGTLILPNEETLRNVLRIHTVETQYLFDSEDTLKSKGQNLRHVINDKYQWFAQGYRYPVVESVSSSTYHNQTHIATRQYSLINFPSVQRQLNDTVNEARRGAMSIRECGDDISGKDISRNVANNNPDDNGFQYKITTSGNGFSLEYTLSHTARMQILLVNIQGTICHNQSSTSEAGGCQSVFVDTSGLPPGQYIVYINIDGKVYSDKVVVN